MHRMTMKLTAKQNQLFEAIKAGAELHYMGWQQIGVNYGPKDPRNYIAMQATLIALRDRGLITLGKEGVTLV